MTNIFTQDRVAKMMRDLGQPPRKSRIFSAIAICEAPVLPTEAESAAGIFKCDFDRVGDRALVDDTWGPSYSAFQIRSLWIHEGTGEFRDANELIRPRFAGRSAIHIQETSGWRAWTTYKTGAYKAYLQDMFPPEPGTYVVVAGDTLTGIGDKLGLDWRWLAAIQKPEIVSPWTIYQGQILVIEEPLA